MPLMVRVRGKRRRKVEAAPPPSKKPVCPQSKPKPAISQLELLPTEILQEIFFECPNFALPQSSNVLYQKLTSDHVKVQLVQRYFGCFIDYDESGIADQRLLPTCSSGFTLRQTTPEILLQPQLSIPRAPWFTFRFLQECRLSWYLRNATMQLKHFLRAATHSVQQGEIAKLQRILTRYVHRFDTSESISDPDSWLGNYLCERDDGIVFSCGLSSGVLKVDFKGDTAGYCSKLSITTHKIAIPAYEKETITNETTEVFSSHLYAMPGLHSSWRRDYLPSKFLKAPFTQAKGDLLQAMSDTSVLYRLDEKVLDEALHSAIDESCYPAIDYLLGETSNAGIEESIWKDFEVENHKGLIFEPTCTQAEEKYMCLRELDLSSVEDSHLARDAPWSILKGTRRRHDIPLRPVFPGHSHLIKGLEVALHSRDEDFYVFRWLVRAGVFGEALQVEDIMTELSTKFPVGVDGQVMKDSIYYKAWDWLLDEYHDLY